MAGVLTPARLHQPACTGVGSAKQDVSVRSSLCVQMQTERDQRISAEVTEAKRKFYCEVRHAV